MSLHDCRNSDGVKALFAEGFINFAASRTKSHQGARRNYAGTSAPPPHPINFSALPPAETGGNCYLLGAQ